MEGHQDGQGAAAHDKQKEAEESGFVQFGEGLGADSLQLSNGDYRENRSTVFSEVCSKRVIIINK